MIPKALESNQRNHDNNTEREENLAKQIQAIIENRIERESLELRFCARARNSILPIVFKNKGNKP